MIQSVEGLKRCYEEVPRRKPLQLFTGLFRKGRREESSEDRSPGSEEHIWMKPSGNSQDFPEPHEALHSPYHARTIDQEMENLRLSRQDNPYLQVLASHEGLNESDDGSEYEEKHLMSKENIVSSRDPLTVAEVHARLVRSPPPVWTRSRNSDSEPSFSRLTGNECVFQFPPRGGNMERCGDSSPRKLLGPFDYSSRMRDNTLEAVTGKFNLSPQPRRHSKGRVYSDLT